MSAQTKAPARTLEDLCHTIVPLPNGGQVFVLDTGALIGPEAQAMLGALHSRNPKGILEHLKILARKGPEEFMKTFYVGYGHKSIGDLGATTVAIEGVSMLAAKAIQDFPLYNGQEVSTRYVDFAAVPFCNPVGTYESHDALERLRAFYLKSMPVVIEDLRARFPAHKDEPGPEYTKAIHARAFDILRGFLPVGATTNLVWFGELRQFADQLPRLRNHPLAEVRSIGTTLRYALVEAFPDSFSMKEYRDVEKYHRQCGIQYDYLDEVPPADISWEDRMNRRQLAEFRTALATRPPKVELPWEVRECGTMQFRFRLDFGSFRDWQRQRALITRMPLVNPVNGFEPWYVTELPESLRRTAADLVESQFASASVLTHDALIRQYYLPMGTLVPIRTTGDLRALVYAVDLRATRFVHPTLRRRATQMANILSECFATEGLVLHLDPEPDRFDAARGRHDIVEKS